MRLRRPYIPKGVQTHNTHIEIDDVEQAIIVTYYCQQAEADTNTPEGIELDGICYISGLSAWDDLSEDQKDQLAVDIAEYGDNDGY